MAEPSDDKYFFKITREDDSTDFNAPGTDKPAPEPALDGERLKKHIADKYEGREGDTSAPLFDPENPDGIPDLDPLYDIACQLLPNRPVIRTTLDHIYNINFIGLVTAGIIEDACRGKLADDQVDRLTAAALIAAAENRNDAAGFLPAGTFKLGKKLVAFAENPALAAAQPMTAEETCLYESYLIAKLEVIHKGLMLGEGIDHDALDLNPLADILSALSKTAPDETTARLSLRACSSFNAVAADYDLPKKLDVTKDRRLQALARKSTPFKPQ